MHDYQPSSKKHFIRTYSPLRTRIPRYPRSRLLRLLAVVAVLTICLAALKRDIIRIYYQSLRNAQTDFGSASLLADLPSPTTPLRALRGGNKGLDIDDRFSYITDLGRGCEGLTQLYEDKTTSQTVVVKSWFLEGRNPLPAKLRQPFQGLMRKWPAEIQATLLFAGLESGSPTEAHHNESGFLPALDYFLAVSTRDGGVPSPSWRLVTPYVHGGTLDHLARRLQPEQRSTHDLDATFRPSLNSLLAVLSRLHSAGYCHDDVKPDNILAPDPTRWLLSDLGNVREAHHPYHLTADWTGRNQWRDCRANDLRRALKTYLTFLRAASAPSALFDDTFLARRASWSALYWDFVVRPVGAEKLLERSRADELGAELKPVGNEGVRAPLSYYRRNMLAVEVTRELACIPLKWSWGLWGWVGWLRPQPQLH